MAEHALKNGAYCLKGGTSYQHYLHKNLWALTELFHKRAAKMSFTKVYILLFFITTPKLSNFDTATEEKNATKWLHITHFNGLEPYLSNRLKKFAHHRVPMSMFFIIMHKFDNCDTTTDRKCRKIVTHHTLNEKGNCDALAWKRIRLPQRTHATFFIITGANLVIMT